MDQYLSETSNWFGRSLSEPGDTRAAFERLLQATTEAFTRQALPAGCMISLAGTHVPPSLCSIRDLMMKHRATSETALVERLRRGVTEGDLPPDTDVEVLAVYFSVLFRGMAVRARDGASRKRLLAVARVAMRAWPTSKKASK